VSEQGRLAVTVRADQTVSEIVSSISNEQNCKPIQTDICIRASVKIS
jgi:hypothetical protein